MTERMELDCVQEAQRDQTYVLEGLLCSIACVQAWMSSYRCLKKAGITDVCHVFIPCLFERLDRAC